MGARQSTAKPINDAIITDDEWTDGESSSGSDENVGEEIHLSEKILSMPQQHNTSTLEIYRIADLFQMSESNKNMPSLWSNIVGPVQTIQYVRADKHHFAYPSRRVSRVEEKNIFTLKWSFVIETACRTAANETNLPCISYKFQVAGNVIFTAFFNISGESCADREFCLRLETASPKPWGIACKVTINGCSYRTCFTQDHPVDTFSLYNRFDKTCLILNPFNVNIISCEMIYSADTLIHICDKTQIDIESDDCDTGYEPKLTIF